MNEDREQGMNRREFIRKAAVTGAVAWAVPAIQTVAATPAYAGVASPICNHGQCVSTCEANCARSICEDACDPLCLPPDTPSGGRRCCVQACLPSSWDGCDFVGSTMGCPPSA